MIWMYLALSLLLAIPTTLVWLLIRASSDLQQLLGE